MQTNSVPFFRNNFFTLVKYIYIFSGIQQEEHFKRDEYRAQNVTILDNIYNYDVTDSRLNCLMAVCNFMNLKMSNINLNSIQCHYVLLP